MAEKSEGAMLTIGEVADKLNIKAHILRYWEEQFPMLQPLKRAGGRRYYRPNDVVLLERIDTLLNQEGYTIKGAVAALRAKRSPVTQSVTEHPAPANGNEACADSAANSNGPAIGSTAEKLSPDVRQKLQATRDKLSKALAKD